VPIRKDNMIPNTATERAGLRTFRTVIETVNSQAEAMGLQRLRLAPRVPLVRERQAPPLTGL